MVFVEIGIDTLQFIRTCRCTQQNGHVVAEKMHAWQSASGPPHQGTETSVMASCANRPHQPNQEPKVSVMLHHAGKITSMRIQGSCRPPLSSSMRSPSALVSPNNAPRASALITALQKCTSPELTPLTLFRNQLCLVHSLH